MAYFAAFWTWSGQCAWLCLLCLSYHRFVNVFLKLKNNCLRDVLGYGCNHLALCEICTFLQLTTSILFGLLFIVFQYIGPSLKKFSQQLSDSTQAIFVTWVVTIWISCFLRGAARLTLQMRIAGSFSRSAVMQEAGAKTGFAGVFMGLLVTSCLLFFTPLFADIPQVSSTSIASIS